MYFRSQMEKQVFIYDHPFVLESGVVLPALEIVYHTYGSLNQSKSNVIWVCHALTANSDVYDWWDTLFGKEGLYNEHEYFIVCANILGSCYGSSGPLTTNRLTGAPYYSDFPKVTIRDMVGAHQLLAKELGIESIHTAIGGSMGGYQAMEWAISEPDRIERLVLLCTSAKESAWGIAIHSAQRMAIETDLTWKSHSLDAGKNGIKTARAIGMLSYRNYQLFVDQQDENDTEKMDNFRVSSYLDYQGDKLMKRFNCYSYWLLTKAMDSHNVGRGRGSIDGALSKIKAQTIIIGISTDILCPLSEQQHLHRAISHSHYATIDSEYGHDGFLIEGKKIKEVILNFNHSSSHR